MPNPVQGHFASVARRARAGACMLALGFGFMAVPQTALAELAINKSFLPINIRPAQTSVVTIRLFNTEPVALSNAQFTDNLPNSGGTTGNLTIVGVVSSSCGGTLTATAGTSQISLTGGTVPAQTVDPTTGAATPGTCAASVTVTGNQTGTYVNTIPAGQASGNSGPNGGLGLQQNPQNASATLTIAAFTDITGSKAFQSGFLKGGGSTTFTVTLNNPNGSAVTGVTFTDNLPAQLRINGAGLTGNTCGGAITDPANGALNDGDTGFLLTGGTVPANASCVITISVREDSPNSNFFGTQTNTIAAGAVTTAQGITNSGDLTASISVQSGGSVDKAFATNNILSDGVQTTRLTISLQSLNVTAINGASVTDNLPTGVSVAAVPNLVNNCGGTVAAAAGATSIVITGANIPAAPNVNNAVGACTVAVDVVTTTAGTNNNVIPAGSYGPGLPNFIGTGRSFVANNLAVSAAKAFNPASVARGGTTTLTITLSNISTAPATISSFTDDLTTSGGAGLAVGAGATTTCGGTLGAAAGGTAITLTNGTIPAGTPQTPATCTIVVPVTVQANAASGAHVNTILAGGLQTNRGTNNSAATATLTVPVVIGGSKTFAPSTVAIGNTSTLTITLTNATATPATINATNGFTDNLTTLDTGGRIQVAAVPVPTNTCGSVVTAVAGSTSITASGGTIPANGSCTITVGVVPTVGSPTGALTNRIPANGIRTSAGNNVDPITAVLTVAPAISGTKVFNPAAITRGQTTTLTITLNNADTAANATAVALTDDLTTLGTGYTVGAGTPTSTCGGAINAPVGGTQIGFTGGTIPAATGATPGTCQITVPVAASLTATLGARTNTIPAGNVQSSLGNTTTAITAPLAVMSGATVAKAFVPASINQGGVSRLTVTIGNPNTATALTGVGLTDRLAATLGAGHAIAAVPNAVNTCGGTLSAVAGAATVTLAGGTLPAGTASCSFSLDVRTPNTVGTGTNSIPAGALTTNEQLTNGAAAAATLTRTAAATNVTLNKSFNPVRVSGGSSTPSVLQVTVDNSQAGSINLTGVALTDNLPNGMIVFSTPNGQFTGTGCSATVIATAGANSIGFAAGTVPAGTVCTLSVNVTGVVGGNLINTIPVNALTSNQNVTNANSPSATLTVLSNIEIVKSFTQPTIAVGQPSTLTLRFTNVQQVTSTNGALIDTFPAGLVIVTGSTPATTCANATVAAGTNGSGQSTLTLTGATFNQSPNDVCTVTAQVTSATAGQYLNTIPAGALTTQGQGATNGNPASATLTVDSLPTIAKAFAPATIAANGVSTITFTLTNNNTASQVPGGLTGATFNDALASGLSVSAAQNAGGTCAGATGNAFTAGQAGTLTFSNLTIPPSASCTVTIAVTSATPNTYQNIAGGITTTQTPNNPGPPSSPATLTVLAPPTVTKAFLPTTIPAGQISRLTISLVNSNATALTIANPGLTDPFPAGLIVAPTPNAATTCANGTITSDTGTALVGGAPGIRISNGTIPANASCTVSVDVTSSVAGSYVNTTGPLTTTQAGPSPTGGSATLTVIAPLAPATIAKAFSPATVPINGISTITFTLSNANTAAQLPGGLTGATFTDALAAGLVVSANQAAGGTCVGAGTNAYTANQAGTLTIAGLTIPPAASCTVTIAVRPTTAGTFPNTASGVTTTQTPQGPPSPTVNLTTPAPPTVTKAFSPSAVPANQPSVLTITLTNPNATVLTIANPGLTDTFPTTPGALTVAPTPNASTTCAGGTLTSNTGGALAGGAPGIRINNGTIPANASCTVTVSVVSATTGSYNNLTGLLNTVEAGPSATGGAATLTIGAALAPATIAKAFSPATVPINGISTITFTLSNANTAAQLPGGLTGATFTDALAAGLVVSANQAAGGTCVGAGTNAYTANQAGTLTIAGLTIPPAASCTVTIAVRPTTAGTFPNTAGAVTTTQTPPGQPSGPVNLVSLAPPTVTKAFTSNAIAAGGTSVLTITLTNPNPSALTIANPGLTDSFPTTPGALTVAPTPNASTTCAGGTITDANGGTLIGGSNGIRINNGTIPANANCTVTVTVTATATGTYVNTTGVLNTIEAGPSATGGTDSLTVGTTPTITGRVFRDSGPTANNGVQDSAGNEPGLSGVGVRLTNCAATVYSTATTNSAGDYSLSVPGTVANGSTVCVEETNPSGYLSTGANVAGTPLPSGTPTTVAGTSFTYTRTGTPDRTQFTYSTATPNYTGINFGDVPPNAFTTDNRQVALPGTVLNYPHTYNVQDGGTVTFASTAASDPAVPGWAEVLYADANCNGLVDPSESPLTGPVTVVAGQVFCIVDREFVPANAPVNGKNLVTLTATFSYANANPALPNNVQTHTDLTIVGDADGAELTLTKAVSSPTASPGTILTYTVTYANRSTQPLSNIVVNDATPPFTTFVSAAAGPLPANLTACSKTTPSGGPAACATAQPAGGRGALSWTFTGTLQPGSSGVVTFQVQVEQ